MMKEQRIKDWPTTQRPRERLLQFGPEQVTDAELIAILVGHGTSGQSAVATARMLLKQFGSIRGILNASPPELVKVRGMGASKTARLIAARECGCRNLQEKMTPGKAIRSPDDSRRYLVARLRDRPHEVFCCMFLDNRHRVLAFDELFRGTIDATTVYPREVVKQALYRNAAAVILAHNHPSGIAEPSQADRLITRRIRDALDLIDIRLLDHFIVGDGDCVSLAGRGEI